MKYVLPMLLSVILVAGCDGMGVGNRRTMLLSPQEAELVKKSREINTGTRDIKPTPRGLLRPMSVNKEAIEDDSGGTVEKLDDPWKFRWSWDKGIATPGKPSADNPDYDDNGNLIVKPEVVRALKFPDLHSGVVFDITESKLRAILEVEIAEFKTPVLGKMATGVVVGEEYLGFHISKQIIPIFEIEAGLAFGRDFEEDENTIGIEALIIKF
jgi:hypothetical protein